MKIPIIAGPTAVGKSDMALKLAEIIDGEIISVDSMQIYNYMDIGTSKIDKNSRNEILHYMIDIVNPDEEFDVKKFRDLALKIVDEIILKSKKPILVGGSGLYIEALKYGIFDGPSRDVRLRDALLNLERESPGSLRKLLLSVDPVAAKKFAPRDLVRTVRALEVYLSTGESISELWNKRMKDERFVIFVLHMDRQELYKKIDERVERMFKNGFIEEVAHLIDMGYSPNLNSMRSIGYKEVVQYLEGAIDLEECIEKIKLETHHYAKRQLIWFRKYPDAVWLDVSQENDQVLNKILKILNWGAR